MTRREAQEISIQFHYPHMSRENCQEFYLAVEIVRTYDETMPKKMESHATAEISIWQLYFKSSSTKEVPSFSLHVLLSIT